MNEQLTNEAISDGSDPSEHSYPQYVFSSDPSRTEPPKKAQSKLGIASFIVGLVSLVVIIVAIIIATTFIMDYISFNGNTNTVASIEDQVNDLNDIMPLAIAGLLLLFSVGSSVVGLILGIVGACSKDKRKVFSVIGIVLNALLPVGFVTLFLIGILLGGNA